MVRLSKIEKEIREYTERNHSNLIPASCMRRVVKEILNDNGNFRISKAAQEMLQVEAETMVTGKFSRANRLARAAKRETVACCDFKLDDFCNGQLRQ